jgi:hypothetical protein
MMGMLSVHRRVSKSRIRLGRADRAVYGRSIFEPLRAAMPCPYLGQPRVPLDESMEHDLEERAKAIYRIKASFHRHVSDKHYLPQLPNRDRLGSQLF